MKKISAEIVADSVNEHGNPITTFLLTFPHFILAELNTHRMFSRNSASSRAIPFEKMVKMVEEDPFIPIAWQKDHKGMQGVEYFTDDLSVQFARSNWLTARDNAIKIAKSMNGSDNGYDGVTKQLCNRLLEPFMWHTVLVTATEFENFFNLRCPQYNYLFDFYKSKKDVLKASKDGKYNDGRNLSDFTTEDWLGINSSQAEIHIQALAEAMWDAMNESIPKKLQAGNWHIPFGDKINDKHFTIFKSNLWKNKQAPTNGHNNLIIKIATARAARLSYMTFDGEIDYEKDIKLHDRLLKDNHLSCFEHCARAMSNEEFESYIKGTLVFIDEIEDYQIEEPLYKFKGWCNNFKGFINYRYILENK